MAIIMNTTANCTYCENVSDEQFCSMHCEIMSRLMTLDGIDDDVMTIEETKKKKKKRPGEMTDDELKHALEEQLREL